MVFDKCFNIFITTKAERSRFQWRYFLIGYFWVVWHLKDLAILIFNTTSITWIGWQRNPMRNYSPKKKKILKLSNIQKFAYYFRFFFYSTTKSLSIDLKRSWTYFMSSKNMLSVVLWFTLWITLNSSTYNVKLVWFNPISLNQSFNFLDFFIWI